MRTAVFLLAGLSACALAGPSREDDPRDVEKSGTPKVTDGACEGDQAPTLTPSSFFAGPNQPSSARPDAGTLVALEGVPRAQIVCSQRGCESECCDNGCGANTECPYTLTDGAGIDVCLAHDSFTCGGTDCSPFCEPFSSSPKRRYRFVGRIDYRQQSLGQTPLLRIERFCVAE